MYHYFKHRSIRLIWHFGKYVHLHYINVEIPYEINLTKISKETSDGYILWRPDNSHKYAKILCELIRMCTLFTCQWRNIQSSPVNSHSKCAENSCELTEHAN